MASRYVGLVLFSAVMVAVATGVVADALTARQVTITPLINWTGPVLLEIPQNLLGSGVTGLYMSNASDCSTVLPTWWDTVGGLVYIIYNDSRELVAGNSYSIYLCYGDIIVPKDYTLFGCDLPGTCSINYTEVNASLTNTTITVDVTGTLETTTLDITNTTFTTRHVYGTSLSRVLVENVTVEANTTYPWPLQLQLLDGTAVVASAPFTPVYSYNTTDTRTYDTGTAYYDTGVVTIYTTPYPMYAREIDITINVYDSDWDTYYVYLYVNGTQVASWYQQRTITYTLYNTSLVSIAVRVYDTERNDYVRAYGSLAVTYTHYISTAVITTPVYVGSAGLAVAAAKEYTLDGNTATVNYYPLQNVTAQVSFNTTNGVMVAYNMRMVQSQGLARYNTTTVSADSGASISIADGYLVLRGDNTFAYTFDPQNALVLTIDTAAANLYTYGIYDYEAVTVETPRTSTLNFTLQLLAAPGTYNLTWERLLIADALTNYTVVVGAEYTPSTSSGGASGTTLSNATIVVNVQNTSPYATNYWLASVTLASVASLAATLWLYMRGWRANRLDYSIMALAIGIGGSVVVFALGDDKIARILLVATALLFVYSIVERMADILVEAARGRFRKPF